MYACTARVQSCCNKSMADVPALPCVAFVSSHVRNRLVSSDGCLQVFSTAENRILGYVVAGCIVSFVLFYFFFRHR